MKRREGHIPVGLVLPAYHKNKVEEKDTQKILPFPEEMLKQLEQQLERESEAAMERK